MFDRYTITSPGFILHPKSNPDRSRDPPRKIAYLLTGINTFNVQFACFYNCSIAVLLVYRNPGAATEPLIQQAGYDRPVFNHFGQ